MHRDRLNGFLKEDLPDPHPLAVQQAHCPVTNSETEYLALFWPRALLLRLILDLPPQNFHITLFAHPRNIHQVSKRATSLANCSDIERLLEDARGLLKDSSMSILQQSSFSTKVLRTHLTEEVLHLTDTMRQTISKMSPHDIQLNRKVAETRLVCLRMVSASHEAILFEAQTMVEADPTSSSAHFQKSTALFYLKQYQFAVTHAWASILLQPDLVPSIIVEKAIQILAKCQRHLNTVRLDVVMRDSRIADDAELHRPQNIWPRCSTREAYVWPQLSQFQRRRHSEIMGNVEDFFWKEAKQMKSASISPRYSNSFRIFVPSSGLVSERLPRYFSWFIPFKIAASSLPKAKDIRSFEQIGFTAVVTLCIEHPLDSAWFNDNIRNVFLPITDHHAPSFTQLDAFFAEATMPGARLLVHCFGGKGRTGLFWRHGRFYMDCNKCQHYALCVRPVCEKGSEAALW